MVHVDSSYVTQVNRTTQAWLFNLKVIKLLFLYILKQFS